MDRYDVSSNDKHARKVDFRIYKTSAELDDAFEASGGEVTPEVEAIEKRLSQDADTLGLIAAAMLLDAKAQQRAAKDEQARIGKLKLHHERREAYARRLLRTALDAKGERRAQFGSHRVHITKGQPRVEPVPGAMPDWEDLEGRGLATTQTTHKLDKGKAKKELANGAEVPGFRLGRGPEGVTVR